MTRYRHRDYTIWWTLGGIALFVGLVSLGLWYEWRYPCLKSETYACTRTYCAMSVPVHVGEHGTATTCTHWVTEPDTCTRCLERGDRKKLPAEAP